MVLRTTGYLLAACLIASAAAGAAYDDFAKGLAAYERSDFANAITGFTAAIDAGDLAPSLKVTAYLARANAYLAVRRCKESSQDIAAAKSLNANGTRTTEALAAVDECLGDYGGAASLYTGLIAGDARWDYFWERGRARWANGDFTGAASDFGGIVSVKPDYAYPLLWLAFTDAHAGKFDNARLARDARSIDLTEWPGALVKFYLGQARQEDVDAAVQGDGQDVAGRRCEANFYIGEWQLAQNNRTAAAPLLQSAAESCPLNFVERDAAHVEVARLK